MSAAVQPHPMSEAPKDGTPILAWCPALEGEDAWWWPAGAWVGAEWRAADWRLSYSLQGSIDSYLPSEPTCWLPMPPDPQP